MNYAIITAGGKGTRMKSDINKSFMLLNGKELLAHTMRVYNSCKDIDKIIIVINEDCDVEFEELIQKYPCSKYAGKVSGGKERQDSVWNGIQKAISEGAKDDDVLLVHSACNPLIKEEEISACVEASKEFGGAVAAMPAKDTIHVVDENKQIETTLDRKKLFMAQTPQCGKTSLLKKAFEKAFAENFYGTDEMQLLKRIGVNGKIVECSFGNIKITTPLDMKVAEKIIEIREFEKEEGKLER